MKFLLEYLKYSNGEKKFNGWWEIDGDRLYNRSGGWHHYTPSPDDVVVEAVDWDDLDYSPYLFPDSEYGWLSPDGQWYGCEFMDHYLIAKKVLHSSEEVLELDGWVKAFRDCDWNTQFYCGQQYTRAQYDWMLMRESGRKFIEEYPYFFDHLI